MREGGDGDRQACVWGGGGEEEDEEEEEEEGPPDDKYASYSSLPLLLPTAL